MTVRRHAYRVYYEDTDAGGVVYHASYLRFAERARTEAMRDAGAPHSAMTAECGLVLVVRALAIRYARPARLDDLLTVETAVLSLGSALVRLRQDFFVNGAPMGGMTCELACIGVANGRPARIPARWRAALSPAASAPGPGAEQETPS